MKVFGREIIRLSSVDSTNNFAATLISDQLCQNGMAILADSQTNGKGQRGNLWQSEPGKNLLVSFIFKPDNLSVSRQNEFTWKTSVCIVKTLGKFNIEARIKWPNDILVNGKKIAGILIENQLLGELITTSTIGIGLNVNQKYFWELEATSILNESTEVIPNESVFKELCRQMDFYFDKTNKDDINSIKLEYDSLIFQMNETCFYEDKYGKFKGIIIGIKENGLLQVKVGNEIKEYGIKEIRYCSK
jgi:BirA family biotin operon repressor/biotin-[acetyl-CoA-carboxylase] ligase